MLYVALWSRRRHSSEASRGRMRVVRLLIPVFGIRCFGLVIGHPFWGCLSVVQIVQIISETMIAVGRVGWIEHDDEIIETNVAMLCPTAQGFLGYYVSHIARCSVVLMPRARLYMRTTLLDLFRPAACRLPTHGCYRIMVLPFTSLNYPA